MHAGCIRAPVRGALVVGLFVCWGVVGYFVLLCQLVGWLMGWHLRAPVRVACVALFVCCFISHVVGRGVERWLRWCAFERCTFGFLNFVAGSADGFNMATTNNGWMLISTQHYCIRNWWGGEADCEEAACMFGGQG